jgi:hypothetical protein
MNNKQICDDMLTELPDEFYGTVELSFHKGRIMQSKTVISKKYNPESKTTEARNDNPRK